VEAPGHRRIFYSLSNLGSLTKFIDLDGVSHLSHEFIIPAKLAVERGQEKIEGSFELCSQTRRIGSLVSKGARGDPNICI
jgi:hypothetical protein